MADQTNPFTGMDSYQGWLAAQDYLDKQKQQSFLNEQEQRKLNLQEMKDKALADYYQQQGSAMLENAAVKRSKEAAAVAQNDLSQAYPILSMVVSQPDDIAAAAAWDSVYEKLPESIRGILPKQYNPNMVKGYTGVATRAKDIAQLEGKRYAADQSLAGKEAAGAYSLERIKLENQGKLAVANIRAAQQTGKSSDPKTYQAAAIMYAKRFEDSGDERDKQLAEMYMDAAQKAKTIPMGMGIEGGQIVPTPKAAQQPAPVIPPKQVTPMALPASTLQMSDVERAAVTKLKQMNPSVSEERLLQAYRARQGK